MLMYYTVYLFVGMYLDSNCVLNTSHHNTGTGPSADIDSLLKKEAGIHMHV